MITRQQAMDLFGGAVRLAAALGYTSRNAVYRWHREAIPERAFLKIRYELKPESFNPDGTLKRRVIL